MTVATQAMEDLTAHFQNNPDRFKSTRVAWWRHVADDKQIRISYAYGHTFAEIYWPDRQTLIIRLDFMDGAAFKGAAVERLERALETGRDD